MGKNHGLLGTAEGQRNRMPLPAVREVWGPVVGAKWGLQPGRLGSLPALGGAWGKWCKRLPGDGLVKMSVRPLQETPTLNPGGLRWGLLWELRLTAERDRDHMSLLASK